MLQQLDPGQAHPTLKSPDKLTKESSDISNDDLPSWSQVVLEFLKISIPNSLARLAQQPQFLIIFAVTLLNDPKKIAGVGVALSCFNLGVWCIMHGLITPCEILTASAYGQRDYKLCGVYLYRGLFVINTIQIIEAIVMILFLRGFLLSLGQDPDVIDHCMDFVFYGLPGLLLETNFQLQRRWLSSMR